MEHAIRLAMLLTPAIKILDNSTVSSAQQLTLPSVIKMAIQPLAITIPVINHANIFVHHPTMSEKKELSSFVNFLSPQNKKIKSRVSVRLRALQGM